MTISLPILDIVLVVGYLVAVLSFGLWMGRGQRTVGDFFLGSRNLPWWAILLSIVATETSTVTFLSVPGIAYKPGGNLCFLQLTFGYIIGRALVVWLFLPLYFRGDLFTAYQVLEHRFGGATKRAASVLFLVTRNLADGLRLFLTAIVLERVLGIDLTACIVVLGVLTIVYTFVGGMKAVVWNDCIQFAIYMIGALLAASVLLDQMPGGWSDVAQYARQHGKFRLWNVSFDWTEKYTVWSGLLGGMVLTLATHGTDQLMVQRYLSARSQSEAGRALVLSGFVVCGQFALFLLIGIGLAAFYDRNPPAVPFAGADRVFAHFIVEKLPSGALGLTLAAVFSAAMSTLSSSLNSSATAFVSDFYRSSAGKRADPSHLLRVGRLATLGFGILQIGVAIAGQGLVKSVVDSVLAIASFVSGAVLGLFFLGIATNRTSQRGALIGLVAGLGFVSLATYHWDLAWPWFAIAGSGTTYVVGRLAGQRRAGSSPLGRNDE